MLTFGRKTSELSYKKPLNFHTETSELLTANIRISNGKRWDFG